MSDLNALSAIEQVRAEIRAKLETLRDHRDEIAGLPKNVKQQVAFMQLQHEIIRLQNLDAQLWTDEILARAEAENWAEAISELHGFADDLKKEQNKLDRMVAITDKVKKVVDIIEKIVKALL